MRQRTRIVTCYLCRRKRRSINPPYDDEFLYEVWLHVEVCTEGEATVLAEPVLDTAPGHSKANLLREELIEALSEGLADSLEDMFWRTTDDLAGQQLADLIANLPDSMKAVLENPLENVAKSAGMPAPAAQLGVDVAASLILRPVLEPVEKTIHGLEVIGIVVGLVTGMHPLVIVCAKHLAHDELGNLAAAGFERLMKAPEAQELSKEPSVTDHAAHPANTLAESPNDRAVVDGESTRTERVIAAVCGRIGARTNNIVGEDIEPVYSETALEILRKAEEAMAAPAKTPPTDVESITTIRAVNTLGLLSTSYDLSSRTSFAPSVLRATASLWRGSRGRWR